MPERKPHTPREQLVGMCRVYLLIGAFLIGHAIYKYVEYTKFDEKPGFKLMSDWSAYVRLYEWGGTVAPAAQGIKDIVKCAHGNPFVGSL